MRWPGGLTLRRRWPSRPRSGSQRAPTATSTVECTRAVVVVADYGAGVRVMPDRVSGRDRRGGHAVPVGGRAAELEEEWQAIEHALEAEWQVE